MPNVIKYTTGTTETGCLRKGNMLIGNNTADYGLTFYNGINPPDGGYTIYLNKATGGPSIYTANNNAELISITNQIAGTNYITSAQCLEYYASQTDKIVLNANLSPIVTDGLILCLHTSDVSSYPKTSNIWYDLSGNNNHFTLGGPPLFNPDSGFTFVNGNTSYYAIKNPFSFPTTAVTMEIWYKTTGGDTGIISYAVTGNDNHALLFAPQNVALYGPTGAVSSGINTANGRWTQVVRTSNRSTGAEILYVNGNNVFSTTLASGTNFTSGGSLVIAQEQDSVGGGFDSAQAFGGNIAFVRLYNKTLSNSEILQNYYGGPIVTDGLVLAMDAGNLVSYESGSSTAYSLTGSYNASLINGVAYSPYNGGAWDFDGTNDYIELPYDSYWDTNVFGTATNFTLECWYKPDLFENWDTIIEKSSASGYYSESEGPAIWTNAGSIQGVFSSGVTGNPAGSNVIISYPTTTLKWYHITFTGDGTTLRLYVDGVQRATGAISSRTVAVENGNVGPRFGKRQYMKGKLGVARFYTRALTADETLQNFNAQRNRFGI